jgi:hypothetical protein
MKKPHNLAKIKTKQAFYDDLGLENMGGNGLVPDYIFIYFLWRKSPWLGLSSAFYTHRYRKEKSVKF